MLGAVWHNKRGVDGRVRPVVVALDMVEIERIRQVERLHQVDHVIVDMRVVGYSA